MTATFSQQKRSTNSGTTHTCTLDSTPSSGDLIVVSCGFNAVISQTISAADNNAVSLTTIQSSLLGSTNAAVADGIVAYKISDGTETAITVTTGANCTGDTHVVVFSGGTFTLDDSSKDETYKSSSTTNSVPTGSATASTSSGVVVYAAGVDPIRRWTNIDTVTLTDGTVLEQSGAASGNTGMVLGYKIHSSSGAYSDSFVTDDTADSSGVGYVAIFSESSSSTPISWDGTATNQNGTVGTPFSYDLGTDFSGTETPFSYAQTAGSALSGAGLQLNTSTGVITGTGGTGSDEPTEAANLTGIIITGTDQTSPTPQVDSTTAFSITIANVAVSWGGGTVGTQSATVGTLFELNLGQDFSGTGTPFVYTQSAGTALATAGLSLDSGTGVITGTDAGAPTTATTLSGVVITATDEDTVPASTNAFDINVSAATGLPALDMDAGDISADGGSMTFVYNAAAAAPLVFSLEPGDASVSGGAMTFVLNTASEGTFTFPLDEGSGTVARCTEDDTKNATVVAAGWTSIATNSRWYRINEQSGSALVDFYGDASTDATIVNYDTSMRSFLLGSPFAVRRNRRR